jgi:molybdopterin/thiamine biosynthesis adenylyltransferase
MVPWFLRDNARLTLERRKLEELEAESPWFNGLAWRLEGDLVAEAIITIDSVDIELRVTYPPLFPTIPPIVRPHNTSGRLSEHQYVGENGVLCLEWGPDNWESQVTGADMIQSAFKLLSLERPISDGKPAETVMSRHLLSPGQMARGTWARCYLPSDFAAFVSTHSRGMHGTFAVSFRDVGETWACLIHSAVDQSGAEWIDPRIPYDLPGAEKRDRSVGIWLVTNAASSDLESVRTLTLLKEMLANDSFESLLETDGTSSVDGFNGRLNGLFLISSSAQPFAFIVSEGKLYPLYLMVSSNAGEGSARAPNADALARLEIGIVGAGSVGSKIALSLARMGARRFFLVDPDVFMPENIQRQALDWDGVTQHKVAALARALHRIDGEISVITSQVDLTGQESNAAVARAMARLAKCGLLIDATANPMSFSLTGSVSEHSGVPIVWMEVYGGGFGGMVARSRPGKDPAPETMRRIYLEYCRENPSQEIEVRNRYEVVIDDEVLSASDVDVSIISDFAAKMAVDCISDEQALPYSMYLIGLARKWVFDQPFAVIPIATDWLKPSEANSTESPLTNENAVFLLAAMGLKSE